MMSSRIHFSAALMLVMTIVQQLSMVRASGLDDVQDASYNYMARFVNLLGGDSGVSHTLAAIVLIAVGVALTFLGYRLLKATILTVGFIFGGVVCSYIMTEYISGRSFWVFLAFIIGGLIVGLVAMYFYKFGIFVIGFFGGAYVGIFIFTLIASHTNSNHHYTILFWCLLIGGGIIAGIGALMMEKPAVIGATSWYGAYMAVFTTALLVHRGNWWLYAICTVILGMVGMFFQFRHNEGRDAGNKHDDFHSPA